MAIGEHRLEYEVVEGWEQMPEGWSFVEVAGVMQPAPAPRFSRTPAEIAMPPAHPGQHTDEALADWGFSDQEISQLRVDRAII